ncbi:MAG TPA: hypothetical protein DCL00_07505 [Opitutae bacterium]|nr:hypothetical protein [Opitutae bacterium]
MSCSGPEGEDVSVGASIKGFGKLTSGLLAGTDGADRSAGEELRNDELLVLGWNNVVDAPT